MSPNDPPPTYPRPLTILLADDHALFSDGLCGILNAEADMQVVAQVGTGTEVLPAVHQCQPDLLLLDVNLPRQHGRDLAPILLRDFPNLLVVILTMYAEKRMVETFGQMGVHGYILKNAARTDLLTGIRTVRDGGRYFDPRLVNPRAPDPHAGDVFLRQFQLTPREVEIIRLIREGLSSQQIADRAGLSLLTVNSHRRNVHAKLGTATTLDLIRFAEEQGL
jgi:DNA-binding NarL/FixJ family response regulator